MIEQNLSRVRQRVLRACEKVKRDPSTVRIVAVTKNVPVQAIREAFSLGIREFGENQVQEARKKVSEGAFRDARLYMIGHLQTNKASLAVRVFDEVHSVDSVRVARAVAKFAATYKPEARLPVLIEVNAGYDPAKFGVLPESVEELVMEVLAMPSLLLRGLMTVAPGAGDAEAARKAFRKLRETRDALIQRGVPSELLSELSMGMTSDFEVAIEEGSTMIRLGTAIFGPRPN